MSAEFLIKIRDGAQMMADAANEQLEKMAPPEVKHDPKDFDKLFWENLNGVKGPFQRTSKKSNNNSDLFQGLQQILKEHKGFCRVGDCQYWFDQGNHDIIDRRKKCK